MNEELKKEWRERLMDLTISIGEQLKMEENDQILMVMYLNTPRKIMKFVNWVKARTVDDKINSTPMKVLSAATRIGRGMEPLD